jgi:hypothetical protein
MWMCAALVVAALGLVLITGSGLAFAPLIGCVAMMVVMIWMMGAMGRPNDCNLLAKIGA